MQKCPNCSAPLQDLVEQCSFCGTLTDRGVQVRQARALQSETDRRAAEQRAAAEQVRARAAAQHSVDSAGRWSIYSSLLGSFLCCFVPVGPVLGIIFGMRSRGLAAQHRLPGAGLGTTGLVFGVVGLSLSLMMWIGMGVLMMKEKERRAELTASLGELTSPQLERKAACGLTELELLETHYERYSVFDDFECGELEVTGEKAVLRGARFRSGDTRVPVVACFVHQSQWSVEQLRGDDDCSAPPKEAASEKLEHD